MADLRRLARLKAQKYGVNPTLFERQIGAESGFNPHAVSPAGARGVAQIMPSTAKAWRVNPDRPAQALDAAARNMASYVKQFGSFRNALVAYNAGPGAVGGRLPAETRNYIDKITGGGAGQTRLGKGGGGSVQLQNTVFSHEPTFDAKGMAAAQREYALNRLLTSQHGPEGSVMQRVGLLQKTAPTAAEFKGSRLVANTVPGETVQMPGGGGGPMGKLSFGAHANRPGVGVKPVVKKYVRRMAGLAGPITITTGTNHDQMTVNGNVSDHWDGHGADIAVPIDSAKGDKIAAAALMEAGVSRKKAMQMARKGGLYTLNHNGRRIQVIWKTTEGGNHHNHVHVGIR